jgi:hypothetical protein
LEFGIWARKGAALLGGRGVEGVSRHRWLDGFVRADQLDGFEGEGADVGGEGHEGAALAGEGEAFFGAQGDGVDPVDGAVGVVERPGKPEVTRRK